MAYNPSNNRGAGQRGPGQNQGGGHQGQGYNNPNANNSIKNQFKTEWIENGIKKDAIEFADKFAAEIVKDLTSSQFRNFYGELKRIEMKQFKEHETDFLLLLPKISYAVKRTAHANSKANDFLDIVKKAHDKVKDEVSFKNFCDFFEALLAYHKVHGGK